MVSRNGYIRPAIHIKWVVKLGSMALCGLFGYISAEGVFPLNILLAGIFAAAPYALAWSVEQRAFNLVLGDTQMARTLLILACLCGVFVGIADYSSAVAVRDIVATKIGDLNRVTDDKVGEVKRLQDRMNKIKNETAWTTTYLSPEAYQSELDNLNGDATIMKRSKNCTEMTIDETRKHCARIATAKAHKSMSENRQVLDKEMNELGIQLAKAKAISGESTTHANPTVAATRAFVSWGTLNLNPGAVSMAWGQNSIILFSTILMVSLISVLGHVIGTAQARIWIEENGYIAPRERVDFNAPRLSGPASGPGSIHEPIPLKPVDPATNLVVINGQAQPNSTQADQLMAAAMAALKRYEMSPFAQQEGKA